MKKPNFDFERRERERAKAVKKAEKAAAKVPKHQTDVGTDADASAPSESLSAD